MPPSKQEQLSVSQVSSFRPDIEGMRALAVVLVVLYHVGTPGFDGGFVGVDVFFLISGYLITGLLVRERQTTGRINLRRFYARRIRRLLPASLVVALTTFGLAKLVLSPLGLLDLRQDALATLGYLANYWFALRNTDYLHDHVGASLYQQYWSLAVEEQFYLVWPVLLIGGCLVLNRLGVVNAARVVIASVLAGSFALSVVLTTSAQPWAFFSLPTRAWELALGGLLALFLGRAGSWPAPLAQALGWCGLLLILVAPPLLVESATFPGWAAAVPVIGAAMVISVGTRHRGPLQTVLGSAPLTFIGRLSYSIYLWHWPLLVLAGGIRGGSLSWPARGAVLAGTVVVAWLTYRLVENPLRHQRWLSARPVWSIAVGAASTAVGAAAAVLIAIPPVLHVDRTAEPVAGSAIGQEDWTSYVPSNLNPPLRSAGANFPSIFSDGCHADFHDEVVQNCVYGQAGSEVTVVLFGDSHAAQWFPPLRAVADRRGFRLVSLTKSGCPSASVRKVSNYLGREYHECDEWRSRALDRIATERPELVIIANSTNATHDGAVPKQEWLAGMEKTLDRLSFVPRLTVLADTPYADADVPGCLSARLSAALACSLPRATSVNVDLSRSEAELVRGKGRQVRDLNDYLCSARECPPIIGDTLVYIDRHHLSPQITLTLGNVIERHVLSNVTASGQTEPD
ncbi:acyltransferase [Plantactinospora sp. S1510]|uniref:Acyltransferase n=1 Tax=Plantactinospora alkalitolerans TaxID=2789879 RepID=A0ABS0GXJ3_9ACTN|nr:acyltransferase family protein [Plantactinospora alkalitolerans]MBF9130925.1 acyltransferase [Plantactinospora alkalitolerans]